MTNNLPIDCDAVRGLSLKQECQSQFAGRKAIAPVPGGAACSIPCDDSSIEMLILTTVNTPKETTAHQSNAAPPRQDHLTLMTASASSWPYEAAAGGGRFGGPTLLAANDSVQSGRPAVSHGCSPKVAPAATVPATLVHGGVEVCGARRPASPPASLPPVASMTTGQAVPAFASADTCYGSMMHLTSRTFSGACTKGSNPALSKREESHSLSNGFPAADSGRVGIKWWALLFAWKCLPKDKAFKRLRCRLSPAVIKQLDRLLRLKCKIARNNERKRWLAHCKDTETFPAEIIARLFSPSSSAAMRMLDQEINSLNFRAEEMHDEIAGLSLVTYGLSFFEFGVFFSYVRKLCFTERERVKNKFSKDQLLRSVTPSTCVNAVHNLSNYQLSNCELFALSFGWGFCVPQIKKNRAVIMGQFENLYGQLHDLQWSDGVADGLLKNKLTLFSNEVFKARVPHTGFPLSAWHLAALKELKKNDALVITRPDKGNGVVVMDASDYRQRMHRIIDDRTKFIVDAQQSDQQLKLKETVHKTLLQLRGKGAISEEQCSMVEPKTARIPVLYGLPKLHKPGMPVRPILSMKGCAVHKQAAWVVQVLAPLRRIVCERNIEDSFAFRHAIENIDISEHCMASLDVQSLFTSIPLEKCLQFIYETLGDTGLNCGLERDDLIALVRLCVQNVQFRFDGMFYRQVDGVAMGSPLGPVLADIFMGYIEIQTAFAIKSNSIFYCRYVDDIFVLASEEQQVLDLANAMNEVHPNIKLSVECEKMVACHF